MDDQRRRELMVEFGIPQVEGEPEQEITHVVWVMLDRLEIVEDQLRIITGKLDELQARQPSYGTA